MIENHISSLDNNSMINRIYTARNECLSLKTDSNYPTRNLQSNLPSVVKKNLNKSYKTAFFDRNFDVVKTVDHHQKHDVNVPRLGIGLDSDAGLSKIH